MMRMKVDYISLPTWDQVLFFSKRLCPATRLKTEVVGGVSAHAPAYTESFAVAVVMSGGNVDREIFSLVLL